MRAYGTIEDARSSLVEHIGVLFPLPPGDIILLYRDVYGLYRVIYSELTKQLPFNCDEIIEYAQTPERTNHVETSTS